MEIGFLKSIYQRPGPWVSAYVDLARTTESGVREALLRWRGLRDELADQGADTSTLCACDTVVAEADRGVAMFAAGGAVYQAIRLSEPPARDIGVVSDLPHLLPLVAGLGEPVPWVRVVANHTGADLHWSPGWRPPESDAVEGTHDYPMPKVAAGGWSQSRYQRAAQENWEQNATEVAGAVARAAEQVGAEVLLVAGDPHARQLLIAHLPARWAPLVGEVEQCSAEALEAATVQAIQAVAEQRRVSALDDYHLRGVTGLGAVAEAARRGQIRTLLLPEQGVPGQLWMDPNSTELGLRRDDLVATRDGARPVQACDALMRAAALTDAGVLLTGDGQLPDGGVGAVLRWTDNPRPPASRFTDWSGGS
jgi:hypothetical protein